jgi:hypothetical protein
MRTIQRCVEEVLQLFICGGTSPNKTLHNLIRSRCSDVQLPDLSKTLSRENEQ